jgi:glutamate synthase (NADPH) large chain
MYNSMPKKTNNSSLYNESQAKDNCGFGLIVNRHGTSNREVVQRSILGLTSMTHRGAIGSDGKTGDGCGLLFDLNKEFFKLVVKKESHIDLPELFGIAQVFTAHLLRRDISSIKSILESEDLTLLTIRPVPVNQSILGPIAIASLPYINQIFIAPTSRDCNRERFESCLLQARKKIEDIHGDDEEFYICSMLRFFGA